MRPHPKISSDPNVMTGLPCIRGTRVTVTNIVRQIAAGRSIDDICRDYPYLDHASVRAALDFVADRLAEESFDLLAS